MITVELDNTGKKFGREWIFRNLSLNIQPGERLVILGGNGSGKSTLLQMIAGYVTPNEGKVVYQREKKPIEEEERHRYLSFVSPYLLLPEDYTGQELTEHLGRYKPWIRELQATDILKIAELAPASHKLIKNYSSGMKQRLKLALAFFADTPLLLLDEPLSNLDNNAVLWYHKMIEDYSANRTIIVCSNAVESEYRFCNRSVKVTDYRTGN